jgi:hypothetical protein
MHNRLHPASPTLSSTPTQEKKGEEEEIQIDWVTVSTSEDPEQEVTINWEDGTGQFFIYIYLYF